MKIAIVVDHTDPEVHGSHDYYLAKHLALQGQDVTLISSTSPMLWGAVTKEYIKNKRFNPGTYKVDNFTLIRIPTGIELSFIPFMPGLKKELSKQKWDVIHTHEHVTISSLWASQYCRKTKTPMLLMQTCYKNSARFPLNIAMRLYEMTVSRFIINSAKRIIALTSLAKNYLVKIGADASKTIVLPTGVDHNQFKPDNKNLLKEKYNLSNKLIRSSSFYP